MNFLFRGSDFCFFDLKEGYRIDQQGELITAPYRDIFSFSRWITLSHEVAHGYYARIDFEQLEAEYLEKADLVSSSQDDLKGITGHQDWWVKDSIFEFFAHWFDYKHFFNGEFEFYLWSIWRTYLDIPRVHRHKLDYWTRCLFIRLCHEWKKLDHELKNIYVNARDREDRTERVTLLFAKEFPFVYDFVEKRFSDRFAPIQLTETEKREIVNMVLPYYDLCRLFEDKYVNQQIRQNY